VTASSWPALTGFGGIARGRHERSGGDVVPEALSILERHGCPHAAAVGVMTDGPPIVSVEP
jgi:hypothetical protein